MSRRPAKFTQADLYRAAVAAKRAGMEAVASADGTIRFVQKGEMLPEIAPETPTFDAQDRIRL